MKKIYPLLSILYTINLSAMDANDLINRIDNHFSKDPNTMIIASIDRSFLNPQKNNSPIKKAQNKSLRTPKIEEIKHSSLSSTFIPNTSPDALEPLISNVALQYSVDPKIIHAIIINESNFEPLTFNLNAIRGETLSLLTQLKNQFPELHVKIYERWSKQFASLHLPYNEENIEKAKIIFTALRTSGINFDSSYMQINSQHYNRLGLSSLNIFDPATNIEAGAKIYKDCETRYGGDLIKSVECYNKGSFRGQTSYFDGVAKSYQKLASASVNPNSDIITP